MKKLKNPLLGGLPAKVKDIRVAQEESLAALDALLSSVGDCVWSGCVMTDASGGNVNISAGIVFVDGSVCRFDGASNVNVDGNAYYFKKSEEPIESDSRNFFNGTSKDLYEEYKAVLVIDEEAEEEEEEES